MADPQRPIFIRPEESQPLETSPGHWRLSVRPPVWQPPTDIYETGDAFIVRVEIAGMNEDAFSIELDERYLVIRGSRLDTPEKRAFHQMEIRMGEFSIEVELPSSITLSGAEANYVNGFLRVLLPKDRPQHIPVEQR